MEGISYFNIPEYRFFDYDLKKLIWSIMSGEYIIETVFYDTMRCGTVRYSAMPHEDVRYGAMPRCNEIK